MTRSSNNRPPLVTLITIALIGVLVGTLLTSYILGRRYVRLARSHEVVVRHDVSGSGSWYKLDMILDIVANSRDSDTLQMSPLVEQAMDALRDFMFRNVYRDGWRAAEEVRCDHVIKTLFEYLCAHPAEMPEQYMLISYQEGTERGVCDYLSGMTDRYAIRLFTRLFVPEGFPAIK